MSSVVLPAPLGPIRPTLSPRRMVAREARRSMQPCSPKRIDTSFSSATILPRRQAGSRAPGAPGRAHRAARRAARAACSAARRGPRCACAAPRRPCGSRPPPARAACRRARWPALRLSSSRSLRCIEGAKVAGIAAQRPRSSSTMRVATASRKARSCEINTSAPRQPLQQLLQPLDRVEVEVVGRLVEQQHIGCGHQRLRQRDALLGAARELIDAASPSRCRRCSVSSTRCSQVQPSSASIGSASASRSSCGACAS